MEMKATTKWNPKKKTSKATTAKINSSKNKSNFNSKTTSSKPNVFNSTSKSSSKLNSNSESNLVAALAYLPMAQPFVALIIFLIKKDDPYVKFHSIQALALIIAGIIGGFVIGIIFFAITIATLGIGILLFPLILLYGLAGFILYIVMMIKAYQGERYKLPYIGDWAESFK